MNAGYQGPFSDGILDNNSKNKHSALSGNDNTGELPGESSREDQRRRSEIKELLEKQTEIDSSKVQVAVKDSFVSLTGTVDSQRSQATVKALVESVDGVQDVVSMLEIDKRGPVARNLSGEKDFIIPSPS